MKKTLLALCAVGLLMATPSCKKGENDSALSLSSRTSRISNDWTLTSYDVTNTSVNGTTTEIETEYFDGTSITTTWSDNVDGTVTSGNGTDTKTVQLADYTISKDGNWSANWNTTTISLDSSFIIGIFISSTVSTSVSTSKVSGSWSFIGKAKGDFKNKERIALSYTTSYGTNQTTSVTTLSGLAANSPSVGDTYVYDNTFGINEVVMVYNIDMLKGKEMTWTTAEDDVSTSSSITSGGTTVSATSSNTGSRIMNFVAK